MNKVLGTVLVVSGPSGVGKSTICQAVQEKYKDLAFSISCTTRSPRPGEVDGVHYYFISREEFEKRIEQGLFIEFAKVFDNYYGTLRSEIVDRARQGIDVFLDIDVQGAMQIKEKLPDDALLNKCCEFIFIGPPSLSVLKERLCNRGTEEEDQLKKRIGEANRELARWKCYDYLVINDQLERAVAEFNAIIASCHAKTVKYPEELFDE